jgi:hypothetical protein
MPNLVHQPHAVYIRQHWTDTWLPAPGLYCESFRFACGPDVSEALLTRNHGHAVLTAGTQVLAPRAKLDLSGWFVKVELSQDNGLGAVPAVKWIGVIVGEAEQRAGSQIVGIPIGSQAFQARGLEFLLQRKLVDSAFTQAVEDLEDREIQRSVGFNLGAGRGSESQRRANRSFSEGEKGPFVFRFQLDVAEEWTAANIVDYLLTYHAPADRDGLVRVPIAFDAGLSTEILGTFKPTLSSEGKTVKELLDELVDRRRAMTWFLSPTAFGGVLELPNLRVFTFNHEALNLPSGQVVPPNPSIVPWYQEDDNTIKSLSLTRDDATRIDLVIARGEPLGACWTVSQALDTLDKDWSSTQQTAYNDGATNDAGYASLPTFEDQKTANQAVRNGAFLLKVYRYFRVPLDWDGTMPTGGEVVCPIPFDPEDPPDELESTTFWVAGLRFQTRLPLLSEHDYEDVASITNETLDESSAEYLRPFGVIYHSGTSRYYPIDRLPVGAWDVEPESGGRHWSIGVRMQEEQLGVILDVHGAMQHAIAADEFVAADEADEGDYTATLRWQDIYLTVFAEFDQHVEAREPETLTTDSDAVRELVIRVPNARLDYLVPGTVIGLETDGTLQTSGGGYVRDDREKLKDIAAAAWRWYGQTRRALTGTVRNLVTTLRIGDLISVIGDPLEPVEVYSVITSMTYDVRGGTITIQTQFASLDLTAF